MVSKKKNHIPCCLSVMIYRLCLLVMLPSSASTTVEGQMDELFKKFPKAWNLQDVTIFPGQAFYYKLPTDEKDYSVTESGLDFLPEWLEYDAAGKQLLGVARKEHSGRSYLFQVKGGQNLSDFFRVEVKDPEHSPNDNDDDDDDDSRKNESDDKHQIRHHNHHQLVILCKKSKSRTIASVILEPSYDDPDFSTRRRLSTMERLARFYEIPLEGVRLVSSSEVGDGTLFDNSALVAGPGDVVPSLKSLKEFSRGLDGNARPVLRWTVGCGNVQKRHLAILQRVEKESLDGTLREALQQRIVGWYVTNQKPKDRRRRYLRSGYHPTPTPTLSAAPPTALISTPPPDIFLPSKFDQEVEPNATPAQPTTFTTTTGATVSKSTRPKQKTSKARKSTARVLEEVTPSQSPLVQFESIKSFDLFKVHVGEVFMLEITGDFFSIQPSKLEILTLGRDKLDPNSWIKLSESPGTIPFVYGIPLLNHEGLQDYVLRGTSALGGFALIPMKFEVMRFAQPLFFEVNLVFDYLDYDRFCRDLDLRMNLTRSIAAAVGNSSPTDIFMTKVDRGSVDYWWTTLVITKRSVTCPENIVKRIKELIVDVPSQRVNQRFLSTVEQYGLSYAEVHPRGQCQQKGLESLRATYIRGNAMVPPRLKVVLNSTVTPTVSYRHSFDDPGDLGSVGDPAVESSRDEELLKQIMIPVLIVVALILLSLIVACLVCRRDKKQPKSSDATELVSKGAPVIFAHELDEPIPTLSPRAIVPPGGGKSPRPPNYHRRAPQGVGGGPAYQDFYASEGLMAGQPRYISS